MEMRSNMDSKSMVVVDEEKTKGVTFCPRSSAVAGRTRLIISDEKIVENPEMIESRCGLDEKVLGSFRLKSTESDKYPPLFFTLQDFYSVMNDSGESERERWNVGEEKNALTTFSGESLDRSDENVCFRVTTTNVPFEMCLRGWSGSFGSGDLNFEVDDNSEITRCDSENLKSERSAPFLFSQDTFDDDDGAAVNRSITKVRFLIDSDSSISNVVNLEAECKTTFDGPRDVDLSVADDVEVVGKCRESLSSLEVPELSSNAVEQINNNESIVSPRNDEFDDVPVCTLLNTIDDNENANYETCSSRSYACPESQKNGLQTFTVEASVEARPVISDKAEETGDIVEYNKRDILSEKQFEKSNLKTTERRKIFIDQSLCDLINDDDDDIDWTESTDDEDDRDVNLKIEENSDELDEKLCVENGKKSPVSENDQQSLSNNRTTDDTSRSRSPSINTNDRTRADIRRNSFLENMLRDDQLELETWNEYAPCKIVATHSKPSSSSSSSNTEPKVILNCAKIKSEESNSPENYCESSRVSRLTIVGLSPVGTRKCRGIEETGKSLRTNKLKRMADSINDIVTDVEDPLDDNSRLKTNNNRSVDSFLDENIVRHSVNEEPMESRDGKKKTDEPVDKYSENSIIRAKQTELSYGSALEIDTIDKRAIDRNSPTIQCCNDDNNAVTPVAVRYDQSRGSVSITPNSVRSFVKQHEISENSEESNDVVSVIEKVTKITETRRSRNDEENEEKSVLSEVDWARKIDNEVGYTIVRRGTMSSWKRNENSLDVSSGSIMVGKSDFLYEPWREKNDACKIECKKEKQFLRGQRALISTCVSDENSINSVGSIIGTKLKRKAPGKPSLETETGDRGERVSLENGSIAVNSGVIKIEGKVDRLMTRRFDDSLPRKQERAGAEDQDGTVRSGIDSLVPKSTSTQFDQPCVFYCTV